jgi:hypothetical protein
MSYSPTSTSSHLLVVDAAQYLLKRWGIALLPVILLFTAMLFGNVFEGILLLGLIWFFILVLPSTMLLFIALFRPTSVEKLVAKSGVRILQWLSFGYMLALLLFLVTYRIWLLGESPHTVSSLFSLSLVLFLPLNLLLTYGLWMLLFQSVPIFGAFRSKKMVDYLIQKAEAAGEMNLPVAEQAYRALSESRISEVFAYLETTLTESTQRNDLLVLQADYHRIQHSLKLQTEDPAVARWAMNRITLALAEMINIQSVA